MTATAQNLVAEQGAVFTVVLRKSASSDLTGRSLLMHVREKETSESVKLVVSTANGRLVATGTREATVSVPSSVMAALYVGAATEDWVYSCESFTDADDVVREWEGTFRITRDVTNDTAPPDTNVLGYVLYSQEQALSDAEKLQARTNIGADSGGVTDHGALTGLADDDHSQYHTDARGDARYSPLGHNHNGVYDPVGTAASTVSVHEAEADPHPGYLPNAESGTSGALGEWNAGGTLLARSVFTTTSLLNAAWARENHSGTQLAVTISDFNTAALAAAQSALAEKSDSDHTHADATGSVAGFMPAASVTKLAGIATGATANATDADLRARSSHTGTQLASTISDFSAAASAASPVQTVAGRTGAVVIAVADVTGAESTANKAQPSGYASLDSGGKIPQAQLPSIAVTEYLGDAANQAAMLALSGQKGDWCTRTDTGAVWIISGTDPTLLGSWTAITYPASPVTSVAGRTGAVTLSATDITDSTSAGRAVLTAANAAAIQAAAGVVIGTDVQGYSAALAGTTASFTTALETKVSGIEALADVTDAANVASSIHGVAGKTTPVDADELGLIDSAASNALRVLTWANLKATLATYFGTIYAAIAHTHAASDITSGTIATARLGSGTADGTTYLRGDGTWATVSAGGSPGGSGSEMQYRGGASTFSAASGTHWDSTNGRLSIGAGTSPAGVLHVACDSASEIPAIFQGAASQTGNLTNWRNSAGTVLASVDKSGNIAPNHLYLPTHNSICLRGDPAVLGDYGLFYHSATDSTALFGYAGRKVTVGFRAYNFGTFTPFFTLDDSDDSWTAANGVNYAFGTATGSKIGTATTQKIGFWNATPVVQQAAVADATDAASVITQLNDLLAKLRTVGIIAT